MYTKISSLRISEKVSQIIATTYVNPVITNMQIDQNNQYLIIENNAVFSKNKTVLFYFLILPSDTYLIPDSVTTIKTSCFSHSTITSITIPKNVKRIEDHVFWYCPRLIKAELLGPLDYFGYSLFYNCGNIELVIFPNASMKLRSLVDYTYTPKLCLKFQCKVLIDDFTIKRITKIWVSYINDTNLIVDKNALIMNSAQTIIYEYWGINYLFGTEIPKTVQIIKEHAFENSWVHRLIIENDTELSVIENYAFMNCKVLRSFTFSFPRLQSLGISVFKNCTKLNSVINISNIPDLCFSGCTSLENVTIKEGSTRIGNRSFENCSSLVNISIPSTIRQINSDAFRNCINLTSVTFAVSNSLEYLIPFAFSGCKSIANINSFDSSNYKCFDNTIYFKKDSKLNLIYHASNSPEKVLIINCATISNYFFNYCNNIENISIASNSVSLIESYAFNKCLKLKYINFPFSVKIVQPHAFNECNSIRCSVVIENKSIAFAKMIAESGIPRNAVIKCVLYQKTDFESQNMIFKLFNRRR